MVNSNDKSEDRVAKRKMAIDFILNFDDMSGLTKSDRFLYAIWYIGFNSKFETFESIHEELKKEQLTSLLVKLFQIGYVMIAENVLNLQEQPEILKQISCINYICHFAAQSHVQNSFEDAIQYTIDNVLGTHTLLENCRKYGKIVKFVHVSIYRDYY